MLDVADRGVDGLGSISNQVNVKDINANDCSNGAGLLQDRAAQRLFNFRFDMINKGLKDTDRSLPDIFSPLPVRHHKSQKVMLTRNETSYNIQLATLPPHILPGS